MTRENNDEPEATVAPGIDEDEQLNKRATTEEKQKNETTKVTTLTSDENDPS